MFVNKNDLSKDEAKSVMVKKFRETHSEGALIWYSLLPDRSIDSFNMFAYNFTKAHASTWKVQP